MTRRVRGPAPMDALVLDSTSTRRSLDLVSSCSFSFRSSFFGRRSPLPHHLMGRPRWATLEQEEFLATFLEQAEDEKKNNGLKPFYSRVTKEFVALWESPTPPKDELGKVTDPAQIKVLADERRGRVSRCDRPPLMSTDLSASANRRVVQKDAQNLRTTAPGQTLGRSRWQGYPEASPLTTLPSVLCPIFSTERLTTARRSRGSVGPSSRTASHPHPVSVHAQRERPRQSHALP
jgi:hypothetical protein